MSLGPTARLLATAAILLAATWSPPAQARADDLKAKVDRIIQPFFEAKKAVGIVVGIVRGNDKQVFSYGRISRDSDRAPDGDTLFEIGSITKTFTALLLAEMAEDGLMKFDDPVRLYLPAGVKVPTRNGKEITLLHLATHTSGLPRGDDGWHLTWDTIVTGNPYKAYHAKNLYAFLGRHELARAPGAQWDYSNVGMGLLGHALARRANMSYEDLVIERICERLGMKSTRLILPVALRSRLATGHVTASHPAANWDFDVLAGCGAIRSCANDMLRYIAANLGLGKNPLQSAMNLCQRARFKTARPDTEQGLGWIISTPADERIRIAWHNGGTFGYLSYAAFVKDAQAGVVVLSNCFAADPDEAGLAILKTISAPAK